MPVVETSTPIFLAPHYDDVALSCGGTVARLADTGVAPIIVTIFGGVPSLPLTRFAADMHALWGVGADDVITQRRAEESCAARALGAHAIWLDFADAIYREDRYTSDPQLFGEIDPAESDLAIEIHDLLLDVLIDLGITPAAFYIPLAVGNHVDHQHLLAAGQQLATSGAEVWAYEDFPYAGDPAWHDSIEARARLVTSGNERLIQLSQAELARRIEAVRCYRSQLEVIFRHQGEPAAAIERYARSIGVGQPAERFWRL